MLNSYIDLRGGKGLGVIGTNTVAGVGIGLLFATFLTGKKSAKKLIPLYAGIGGGVAWNKCAANFNMLKANETRIEQDF